MLQDARPVHREVHDGEDAQQKRARLVDSKPHAAHDLRRKPHLIEQPADRHRADREHHDRDAKQHRDDEQRKLPPPHLRVLDQLCDRLHPPERVHDMRDDGKQEHDAYDLVRDDAGELREHRCDEQYGQGAIERHAGRSTLHYLPRFIVRKHIDSTPTPT